MLRIKRPKLKIKRPLPFVGKDKSFITIGGNEILGLTDLLISLENMSESDFRSHVNSKKNEFQEWIRDELGDRILARSIRWTTTRETTIEKIKDHIEKTYLISRQGS